jgi:hypothetical protein
MPDLKQVSEALSEMDMKGAIREAFGKCPHCGAKAVTGNWLRWCPKKCNWVGPK